MGNKKKRIPFVFTLIDYKAMEEFFERQVSKGWMIEKINSFTMVFRKTVPNKLKFSVDIFPYIGSFDPYNNNAVKEYRSLCEKSGWTFVTSTNKLQVFCTEDQEQAIPIQTDISEEERIVKKSFYSIEVLSMFILFPILLLSLGSLFPFRYDKLFLNSSIVATILLPLFLIPVSMYVIYYSVWLWKAKRNVKVGLPLPRTSLRSAQFRGKFLLIISALALALYIVAVVVDAIGGHLFTLFYLIVPAAGAGVGLWFRKKGLVVNRSRKKNIVIFTVLILSIAIVFSILVNMAGSENNILRGVVGISSEVPDGYKVIRLKDFGLNENPGIKVFSKKSSVVVPRTYEYHEVSSEGTIRTHYYEALNKDISAYLFEEMLKREGSLLYKDIIEASASDWGVDRAYFLKKDMSMILLLKDNVVLMLENELGFADVNIINTSREQLGL